MSRQLGLLVVNRFEFLRRVQQRGVPASVMLAMDLETIFRCYRGFDGLAWPSRDHPTFRVEDGLADIADLASVDAYVNRLACSDECDVVALARFGAQRVTPPKPWRSAGFDLGYFESEWSHFSVVLNELLGTCLQLRRFVGALNEALLIPSRELALEIIAERERAAASGADVEQADCIEAIEILVR